MGRMLNLVTADPGAAVCRLPQPYRMIDKLVSGVIQTAIDQAVQSESEKLAAEELRDGTKVRATTIELIWLRVNTFRIRGQRRRKAKLPTRVSTLPHTSRRPSVKTQN